MNFSRFVDLFTEGFFSALGILAAIGTLAVIVVVVGRIIGAW